MLKRKLLTLSFGFIVVFCLSSSALADSISWDGGAGNGLWESATNWSGDAVPTSSDDVTINNTTVTLRAC